MMAHLQIHLPHVFMKTKKPQVTCNHAAAVDGGAGAAGVCCGADPGLPILCPSEEAVCRLGSSPLKEPESFWLRLSVADCSDIIDSTRAVSTRAVSDE